MSRARCAERMPPPLSWKTRPPDRSGSPFRKSRSPSPGPHRCAAHDRRSASSRYGPTRKRKGLAECGQPLSFISSGFICGNPSRMGKAAFTTTSLDAGKRKLKRSRPLSVFCSCNDAEVGCGYAGYNDTYGLPKERINAHNCRRACGYAVKCCRKLYLVERAGYLISRAAVRACSLLRKNRKPTVRGYFPICGHCSVDDFLDPGDRRPWRSLRSSQAYRSLLPFRSRLPRGTLPPRRTGRPWRSRRSGDELDVLEEVTEEMKRVVIPPSICRRIGDKRDGE
jgi:hypothetical protein